jgi:hypothetical protein
MPYTLETAAQAAFAAQEYDRALEDAARVAFTAETSTAPAVYRMRIGRSPPELKWLIQTKPCGQGNDPTLPTSGCLGWVQRLGTRTATADGLTR